MRRRRTDLTIKEFLLTRHPFLTGWMALMITVNVVLTVVLLLKG